MKISVIDGSNYFKGLLLLIRKDNQITEPEIKLMKHIGKSLGFEKEFCESAINNILKNECITDTPPIFSSKEIAAKFIKDGLALSYSDHDIDVAEEKWLKTTAEKNGIDSEWFIREKQNAAKQPKTFTKLEVDNIKIEFAPGIFA